LRASLGVISSGKTSTGGETLDNRNRGKNLMHKLLLEGRLEITMLRKSAR
jgi:hypothetical protein